MTTADWALAISLCSFLVSLGGFVWNIWSKFIYPRAKVRANIAVMLIFDGDGSPARKTIGLSATNYGPTDITLHNHVAKRRQGFLWFGRNRSLALVNPVDHPDSNRTTGYFPPGFPKKLDVGEGVTVYFAADAPKQWIEKGDLFYFGFSDTFGRYHWCSRANAKKFRKDVVETFGAVEPTKPGWLERLKTRARQVRTKVAVRVSGAMPSVLRALCRKSSPPNLP